MKITINGVDLEGTKADWTFSHRKVEAYGTLYCLESEKDLIEILTDYHTMGDTVQLSLPFGDTKLNCEATITSRLPGPGMVRFLFRGVITDKHFGGKGYE